MNYIKKLQLDVEAANDEIVRLNDIISELRSYVQSSKFTADGDLQGYVSVQDVLNRTAKFTADGDLRGYVSGQDVRNRTAQA